MKLLLFVLYSNSLFLGTDELTDLHVENVLNSPVIDGELRNFRTFKTEVIAKLGWIFQF